MEGCIKQLRNINHATNWGKFEKIYIANFIYL